MEEKRGRGRPPGVRYARSFTLRLDPEEWDTVQSLAEREKLTAAEVVRRIIRMYRKERQDLVDTAGAPDTR